MNQKSQAIHVIFPGEFYTDHSKISKVSASTETSIKAKLYLQLVVQTVPSYLSLMQ